MQFYIVDAFTENIFGGNPAGVVLLKNRDEFPGDDVLIKTAAELRYSETAFVKPVSDTELLFKYFTPAAEVDFCGHATIAAFTVLLKTGFAKAGSSYLIDTLSGRLKISTEGEFIMMKTPPSVFIKRLEKPEEIDKLYAVMGIRREVELLPALITTGFPDIFLPVKNRGALAAIAPDFKALASLTERHGSGGVHAFTLETPDKGITACTRNFAPRYGIDEEAATGTASGGLAYYLYSNKIKPAGHNFCFLQGEDMGRPSKIIASVKTDSGGIEIKVGGKGAILAEGEIYL